MALGAVALRSRARRHLPVGGSERPSEPSGGLAEHIRKIALEPGGQLTIAHVSCPLILCLPSGKREVFSPFLG